RSKRDWSSDVCSSDLFWSITVSNAAFLRRRCRILADEAGTTWSWNDWYRVTGDWMFARFRRVIQKSFASCCTAATGVLGYASSETCGLFISPASGPTIGTIYCSTGDHDAPIRTSKRELSAGLTSNVAVTGRCAAVSNANVPPME